MNDDLPAAQPICVRIPEAVRLTGISRSQIYELMKSGDIEFAKIGSSTLIFVESLQRLLINHRAGAQSSVAIASLLHQVQELIDPASIRKFDSILIK